MSATGASVRCAPWYGFVTREGETVFGSRSRDYTQAIAEHVSAAAIIRLTFRSADAERGFFAAR